MRLFCIEKDLKEQIPKKKKKDRISYLIIVVAGKFKAGYIAHIFILDKTD